VRTAYAITVVELRRFLADRSNIFFAFVFPLLLVAMIGLQFSGGGGGRVAISGSPSDLRAAMVSELEGLGVQVTVADPDATRELVARGRADVGVLVPAAAVTAYGAGDDLTIEVIRGSQARSQATELQVSTAARAVVAEVGQVEALVAAGAPSSEAARSALGAAGGLLERPTIQVTNVSEIAQEFSGLGQYDYGAASQLLLFVFLNSLAGASTLIAARREGVTARTLAAPVSTVQSITGQAVGRLTIAAFQGAYIMAATVVLFGVEWGNFALAALVMVMFALVAAGAAMLLGSAIDNEGAATGLGVGLGLVLAALGGGMFPLELFPDTLRTISRVTPHSWAATALAEIQRHDGTLVDILPQLGVLAGFAAALLILGTWALRRSLARAI
jgi:ABC-2 type transport system permease protein